MTNYKDAKYQFPTSSITSGTFADARISEASVTQHVTATDLTPVRQDILSLALHSAVADNKAAYNLTNSQKQRFRMRQKQILTAKKHGKKYFFQREA